MQNICWLLCPKISTNGSCRGTALPCPYTREICTFPNKVRRNIFPRNHTKINILGWGDLQRLEHSIFNSQMYSQLLSKYQPRIIKTEAENEEFLEVVEELLARQNLTPEESTILELLVKLIEDFEDKHYQLNYSTPRSRMIHLMEVQNITKENLGEIFGSSDIVDQVMNGDLEIGSQQALELGKLFHVDSSLFFNE
jgi:HTH-type transcriptional regulator/antitoxin HigA